ncbi:MAG: hypothetical protein MZU97_24620 [Bacillus subtilis]|nr:hypothetical protein [Bacillus subtilis]
MSKSMACRQVVNQPHVLQSPVKLWRSPSIASGSISGRKTRLKKYRLGLGRRIRLYRETGSRSNGPTTSAPANGATAKLQYYTEGDNVAVQERQNDR